MYMYHKIQIQSFLTINDKYINFQWIELKFCSSERDNIAQVLTLSSNFVCVMLVRKRLIRSEELWSVTPDAKNHWMCFRWSVDDVHRKYSPSGREEQCISTESWEVQRFWLFLFRAPAEFDLLITVMDRYPTWSRVKNRFLALCSETKAQYTLRVQSVFFWGEMGLMFKLSMPFHDQ